MRLFRFIQISCIACILISITACNRTVFLGPVLKDTEIKKIKIGKTTDEQITGWFGEPQQKTMESQKLKYIYEIFGDRLVVVLDTNNKVSDYKFWPESFSVADNRGNTGKRKKNFTPADLRYIKTGKTTPEQLKTRFGEADMYETAQYRERFTYYREKQTLVVTTNKKENFVIEIKLLNKTP